MKYILGSAGLFWVIRFAIGMLFGEPIADSIVKATIYAVLYMVGCGAGLVISEWLREERTE